MSLAGLGFALGLSVVCVCSAERSPEITVTGKLSRVMAIGGESTGWAIQLDSETTVGGKRIGSIELQPLEVRAFEKLENKHVSVTGTTVLRRGLETGQRTILQVSSIQEAEPKVNLTGSEWVLEDLAGRWALDNVKATLTFPEPGKVSGNGSCNRFFASAQVGDGVMKLRPLGSTRMACPEAVMDQESRYLKALAAVERYEMKDLDLLLYCKGLDKPVRFVHKQPVERRRTNVTTSAPVSGRDLNRLFSRVWRVMSSPSNTPSGSIYIFLPNGTLLETSCVETYRIARWALDATAPSVLRVVEDNRPAFTAEITELTENTLRFRQKLARGNETRTITLQGVAGEFVCPDSPK